LSKVLQQKHLVNSEDQLVLISGFFAEQQADFFYSQLISSLPWNQEELTVVGKKVMVPRLVCWYGEKKAIYSYSGVTHQPLLWNDTLLEIKQHIETFSDFSFNSVLANLYRNGGDSMGWHADKEKELGKDPAIASLSLGDNRLFKMRHNKTGELINIELQHGDLLLMSGALQHHWRHCVPKTKIEKNPRINLTFRKIFF
jgi:alkylated DNA repair dioxygenase AlkB